MAKKNGVEIIEIEPIQEGCVALLAFPGVGMVGNIALMHLIEKLGMKEAGHIKSPETPQVVIIHKNRPAYPIRLYSGNGLIAIVSELPVLSHATEELNEELAKWLKQKKVKMLYLLGGFPNPNRPALKVLQVYGIPSDKECDELLRKFKIKPINEGAVFGEQGLLLLTAMEDQIPTVYLMSDSFLAFPDPDAAASLINALNNILGIKVDTRQLHAKGEEIRKKFKDLIAQTKALIEKTGMPSAESGSETPMYR